MVLREDEPEKIRHLVEVLKVLYKYVSKQVKLSFNYLKIYSQIVDSPFDRRNELIQLVKKAFDSNNLEAINHLSSLCKADVRQFLSTNSSKIKLQLGADIDFLAFRTGP